MFKLKERKLRIHFNRQAMSKGKSMVWTIHRSDKCIPASKVAIHVPLESVYHPTKSQPRAYFVCSGVVIDGGCQEYIIVSVRDAWDLIQTGKGENGYFSFV